MFGVSKFNKNQSGQAALEAAIILIAFVVVASVFAFAVLSAGTASTARGEQSIYSGLKVVQSSMAVKGAVIAKGDGTLATDPQNNVSKVIFTVATVSGGDPVRLATVDIGAGTRQAYRDPVVIAYRDNKQQLANVGYTVAWIVGDGDSMLEEGEQAEITADISAASLKANTPFTLELKPPTGAVIDINRTTPASLEFYMTLR